MCLAGGGVGGWSGMDHVNGHAFEDGGRGAFSKEWPIHIYFAHHIFPPPHPPNLLPLFNLHFAQPERRALGSPTFEKNVR